MREDTITLRGFGEEVTVPGHSWGVQREYGPDRKHPIDIALHSQVMIGFPVGVTILLRSDGSWEHWATDFCSDNHYLHFSNCSDKDAAKRPPTEAQRRTLARWWLGHEQPYGLTIGQPVASWAFAGLSPDDVSAKYGDGHKVYLTASCDEDEAIGRRAETDESRDREHLLEQAVEEGRITGSN